MPRSDSFNLNIRKLDFFRFVVTMLSKFRIYGPYSSRQNVRRKRLMVLGDLKNIQGYTYASNIIKLSCTEAP